MIKDIIIHILKRSSCPTTRHSFPRPEGGDAESLRRYGTPHSGGQFASREVGLGANREGSENGEDQPRRSLNPRPLGLGLLFFFLRKLEEARVDLIGHFGKHQQVVAPEALRRLPFTSVVFVETREGDVVPRLLFGSVRPDRTEVAGRGRAAHGVFIRHNLTEHHRLVDYVLSGANTCRSICPRSVARQVQLVGS